MTDLVDIDDKSAIRIATQDPVKDPIGGLSRAFAELNSAEEIRRFLVDLCTPAELRALSERWHVACLLDETDMSYRDISAKTGVSTTTIGRVARFLKDEPHQGYRIVLDRIKDH